jgi:hypothetical protein
LQQVLDRRGGTQRGKPRSRRPEENPLGSRIFDMDCRWPMYRNTNHGRLRYACGLYQQSNGRRCRANCIDVTPAVQLVLCCVRQRVLYPGLLPRLEQRLRTLAAQELASPQAARMPELQRELRNVEVQLATVGRNMALAETAQQRQAMAQVFNELTGKHQDLVAQIADAELTALTRGDPEKEVAAAMNVARRMTELAAEAESWAAAGELFRTLNVRLFLRFADACRGKRVLRKPAGGMVTFGNEPPPIKLYDGPTDRKGVQGGDEQPAASVACGEHDVSCTGSEGHSVGNVRRGTPRRWLVREPSKQERSDLL